MRNMGGTLKNLAGFKALKWQAVNGSLAKRLAIRTLMFAIVISMLPLMQFVVNVDPIKPFWTFDACDGADVGFMGADSILGRVLKPVTPTAFPHFRAGVCKENMNLTLDVVRELMSKNLLSNDGGKALCIGDGSALAVSTLREMGFSSVDEIRKHPFFMLKQKQVVCELDFGDSLFDFVVARDLSKVSVPALLVNEVERVLKPGGVAAMLVGTGSFSHDSLIRSATSISSFLKSSTVVDVVTLGNFNMVAFKKRANKLGLFGQNHLPENCPSIKRNKPLIERMEPLLEEKPKGNTDDKRFSYLPSFVDVPSTGKLVYIDMGSKEAANFSNGNWFLPSYPIDSRAFSVYIVDHDALVLSSHVKSPGVTFIYHPALGGNVKDKSSSFVEEEPLVDDDEFDFLVWFKETVEFADFVVLKMNAGKPEKKFLSELFESGIICFVDELFLHFSDSDHNGNVDGVEDSHMDLIKSLRNVGVFSHQWWGK